MTSDYVLKVEASFGVKVRVGDRVKKGMELGKNPDKEGTLISPVSGTVSNISFNPKNHTLEIKIKRSFSHQKS